MASPDQSNSAWAWKSPESLPLRDVATLCRSCHDRASKSPVPTIHWYSWPSLYLSDRLPTASTAVLVYSAKTAEAHYMRWSRIFVIYYRQTQTKCYPGDSKLQQVGMVIVRCIFSRKSILKLQDLMVLMQWKNKVAKHQKTYTWYASLSESNRILIIATFLIQFYFSLPPRHFLAPTESNASFLSQYIQILFSFFCPFQY